VLSVDVRPELWQVLLNHAQPDWVLPPNCTPSASTAKQGPMAGAVPQLARATRMEDGQTDRPDASGDSVVQGPVGEACSSSGIPVQLHGMVLAYGEWYMSHVVRDGRGLGVLYAPQLRRFTCVRGAQELIQSRTSLQELTALLQVSSCSKGWGRAVGAAGSYQLLHCGTCSACPIYCGRWVKQELWWCLRRRSPACSMHIPFADHICCCRRRCLGRMLR
jgi:hypothetical protein